MNYQQWNRILLGLTVLAPIPYVAYADIYLSEQQAVDLFFPGINLKSSVIELKPEDIRLIEKKSHERVLTPRIRFWKGIQGETVIIDEVVGKHEFITYAVAIN